MPREYGKGFLNVLAYQDQKKATALAGQRQGMLDTERQEQQKFENVLATGRQDLAQKKFTSGQEQADLEKQQQLAGVAANIMKADPKLQEALYNTGVQHFGLADTAKPWRQGGMEDTANLAKLITEKPKQTPATDIDDYVRDYELGLAGDEAAKQRNVARLEMKRAQAGEAGGVRRATLGAELDIKPQIAGAVEAAEAAVQIETGADVKAAAKTGELSATNNMAMYESANNAVSQVAKIDDLITQIEDSDAITGFGAEFFKNVERIKASIGSDVAAGIVTDTEILDAMMGSEVFPLIKSLGIGARGMDTPAERKFLRQVMTGQIDLNKATLLRMAKMRRNVAERSLKRYNKRVDAGSFDNFFKYTGIPKAKMEFEKAEGATGADITTQAEYDKLPSGAIYTEDGQQYRKP